MRKKGIFKKAQGKAHSFWFLWGCLFALSCFSISSMAQQERKKPEKKPVLEKTRSFPKELIVRFYLSVSKKQRDALHHQLGMKVDRSRHLLPGMELVKLPHGANFHLFQTILKAYQRSKLVKYAEPNVTQYHILPKKKVFLKKKSEFFYLELFKTLFLKKFFPKDPLFYRQWALWGKYGISVRKIWKKYQKYHPVIVAVVDTGIDFQHPDLVKNIWKNKKEIPGNHRDDDKNGYIDDTYGWDVIAKKPLSFQVTSGHGTHVSGIIGGVGNNRIGISGVSWHVKLMGVRTVPDFGDETDAHVIEAFQYAAQNGAKVINCSFGKRNSSLAVQEVIQKYQDQVLFVIGVGNNGQNLDQHKLYPAAFDSPNILTVAATNKRGKLAYFSNWGTEHVDLAAPGQSILSTLPNKRYGIYSGTSMSAPHVAGAAALLWSMYPKLTVSQVREALVQGSVSSPFLKKKLSQGRFLSVEKALQYVKKHFFK